MSYCFAAVCCAILTLLTLSPPLIPPDWARLDANGVYLPKVIETEWPSYVVQVALWLGIVGGLLWSMKSGATWGRRRLKDLRLSFWKSPKGDSIVAFAESQPPSGGLQSGTSQRTFSLWRLWTLTLLTLLGFGLRAYALQSLPLIIDEIGFAAHASDILHAQHVPIFAPGHNTNPSVYSWLLAGAMSAFGQNVFAIRLLPLFFGTLSIPVSYRLGRAWYSPRVGLMTAAFLATFPAHVFYSRMSLYDIADPFFALLALAFLGKALRKPVGAFRETPQRRQRDFILAGIFAACAQYFYHGSRLLLPLMIAYTVIELGLNRRRWREALPGLGRMGFAVMVLTLPMFLPRLVHGLPLTGNINPLKLPTDFAENSLRAVLAWVGQPDVSRFWLSASPLLLLPALVAFLAGIVLIRPRDARYWTMLLSLLLTTIFGGAILIAAPLYVRYLLALPALVLLVGMGVQTLAGLIRRGVQLNAPTTHVLEIAIITLICIQGIWVSLEHPAEAQSNITASQWQEQSLAQQAAALPHAASVVLVVPPEFGEIQRITIAHMVAAFGERRALAVNLSQPSRLQAQIQRLPGTPFVLRAQ